MSSVARGVGVATALAVVLAAIAALPGVAAASLTVTKATIDGVTSTSSPPGGVMEARVTATASGSDRWEGTQYRFGSGQRICVNTDDTGGTGSDSFNVTAPGTPGNYDAGFTARGRDDCGGAQSPERVLQQALRVTAPAPNPNLAQRCGINVMLVLDESGSIGDSADTVRDAARAFLNALAGTGSAVSIIDFSTTAQRQVKYTTVTAESIANVFNPYLENGYRPGGWTNWEAAFQQVRTANTQGTVADLVVFMTDGDPTARNTNSSGTVTGLVEGDAEALRRAAQQADLVKGQGSHVFALGVGAAVTKPSSASRLTAVSGFDQFPGTPLSEADYTLVEEFDELADALRQLAIALCRSSVTVTKLVDEGDGVYRPDPGWRFTASVSVPGGYTWVQPAPPPQSGPRSRVTDDDGVASFQWKPDNPNATSTVTLSELVKPGYEFVDYTCTTNAPGRTRRKVRQGLLSQDIGTGTIGPNEYARCTVRNRIVPGTIEIEKEATPQSRRPFPFTGPFEPFVLVDAPGGDESSRIFSGLAPGTYTFREEVPENWELTGITCTDPTVVITGPEVAVTLGPNESVVCTYHDLRNDPPVPPEPPEPPQPPEPPGPPGPPTPPPPPPPSTQIRVEKTAPRVARVGQRIRFTLTVRNVGSVAATNVRVADVPPAALSLAALRTSRRARVVRGGAIWRLGTLAPGARRTIRGSVLVKAGTPGLKRNRTLATAVNARLVADAADTRILAQGVQGQQQAAPPVTG
jgi:uncharacterized repeat protein (TIGR01451 family)